MGEGRGERAGGGVGGDSPWDQVWIGSCEITVWTREQCQWAPQ